ncbi:MAG TPA: recombinase family protein [Candidatus Sulfotelmatobacter sp.]|nr:recombinase family protein [Candidatus Sulfotelmatobacter sp.]
MNTYFGYIRVSTARQGEKGVSLQEQRQAIEGYAHRYNLTVSQWFEERETAAKRGRPIFTHMLRLLRQGRVRGVIMHKIDRSARNLKDWADLGEMIDAGMEVHFVNESLDLHSRGGRLSADIQAVVAADYIRNLREETKKGFYGRLKQGFYPIRAPIGYLDQGKAKPKIPDPERAPLVTSAFELYATQNYSLPRLLHELDRRGLRNRQGGRLHLNGISTLLNNPFYMGLIRIRKTGEMFDGNHEPLISKSLFDKVQAILRGKTVDRLTKHDFTFRRMVRCNGCRFSLIPELQKGHVYYRCQTTTCPTTSLREEKIHEAISSKFSAFELDPEECEEARRWAEGARVRHETIQKEEVEKCRLRLAQVRPRLTRLTDAYLEGVLDRDTYTERKETLLREEKDLNEKIANLNDADSRGVARVEEFLELVKTATNNYKLANPEQKRRLVDKLTSNLGAVTKNLDVTLKPEAELLLNRPRNDDCTPHTSTPRTLTAILDKLLVHFSVNTPVEN